MNVVRSHLVSPTQACIAPVMDVLGQVLQNQELIADVQALVEKSLRLPDDDEPWRESLEDDQ